MTREALSTGEVYPASVALLECWSGWVRPWRSDTTRSDETFWQYGSLLASPGLQSTVKTLYVNATYLKGGGTEGASQRGRRCERWLGVALAATATAVIRLKQTKSAAMNRESFSIELWCTVCWSITRGHFCPRMLSMTRNGSRSSIKLVPYNTETRPSYLAPLSLSPSSKTWGGEAADHPESSQGNLAIGDTVLKSRYST